MRMILILAFIFLTSSSVFAETIQLKSGVSVSGKIIEQTGDYVKIEFNGMTLTFYKDEIAEIKEAESTAMEQPVKGEQLPKRKMMSPPSTPTPVVAEDKVTQEEVWELISKSKKVFNEEGTDSYDEIIWDDAKFVLIKGAEKTVLDLPDYQKIVQIGKSLTTSHSYEYQLNDIQIEGERATVHGLVTERMVMRDGREVKASTKEKSIVEKRNGVVKFIYAEAGGGEMTEKIPPEKKEPGPVMSETKPTEPRSAEPPKPLNVPKKEQNVSANETIAKSYLTILGAGAEAYMNDKNQYPASADDLLKGEDPYIQRDYCGKTETGYTFHCVFSLGGYTFTATPVEAGITGNKTFKMETGFVLTPL